MIASDLARISSAPFNVLLATKVIPSMPRAWHLALWKLSVHLACPSFVQPDLSKEWRIHAVVASLATLLVGHIASQVIN